MGYYNPLKDNVRKLRERYGDNIRMLNVGVLRTFIRYGYYKLVRKLTFKNKNGEKLKFRYKNNRLVITLTVKHKDGYKQDVDITPIVIASNKYGSAIFKRFFKSYSDDVYRKIIFEIDVIETMNSEWINECINNGYNREYKDIFGNRLLIKNGSVIFYPVESPEIILTNPDKVTMRSFNRHTHIENRAKDKNF